MIKNPMTSRNSNNTLLNATTTHFDFSRLKKHSFSKKNERLDEKLTV